VSFVGAAVAGIASPLFFAIVFSAGLVIAVMRALFPPGRLFPIAFASLLAVYAAIFSLFVDEIFRGIDDVALVVGFCLPIAFFVIGCGIRREQIKTLVAHPTIRSEQRVLRAAAWLVPVFLIGATVVLLSHAFGPFLNPDLVFLGAMALIGAIVLSVSRDVAIFLVDAGLLFKEFFRRISRLVIPAFAFVTFLLAHRHPVCLSIPAYLGVHITAPFPSGRRASRLDLFGGNLFFDRNHQHGWLRRYHPLQQSRSRAGVSRSFLWCHAVTIRRVGIA
jgi:hypothetical protein